MSHSPAPDADLAALTARARPAAGCAGEITPQDAWDYLQNHADALLIDVRTLPEWQFVGVPDINTAAGRMATISWKIYPTFELNPGFAAQVEREGASPDAPIFFLCRSGGRSLDAAIAMTREGYRHCFNILYGFEGEPDTARHRGTSSGWKASGLPWIQG